MYLISDLWSVPVLLYFPYTVMHNKNYLSLLLLLQICVVNERLDVVYHTLVKPDNQITNYLTQYSGVTKEMLENVTTR